MKSEAQLRANRQNARRSTGPRTAAGKARSSRNAIKHGLSSAMSADPDLLSRAHELATLIAGPSASEPETFQLALEVAEAVLSIGRARSARYAMILSAAGDEGPTETQTGNPDLVMVQALLGSATTLDKIDRFEKRALSRCNSAIRRFVEHGEIGAQE